MKIEIFKGKDGQFYWHLRARNGRILCSSEGYRRWQFAYKAARLVIDGAGEAVIHDKVIRRARKP